MAVQIQFEAFTFGIRKKNSIQSSSEWLPLADLGKKDFYQLYQEYLTQLDTMQLDDKNMKGIKLEVDSLKYRGEQRVISGLFKSGPYGVSRDVYKESKMEYRIDKDRVVSMPYYFLVHIPKDRNVGIAILQRSGGDGISTVFKQTLRDYFRDHLQDFSIDDNNLVTKELLNKFLSDGGVKQIVLTKHKVPADIADKLGLKQYVSEIKNVEIRIRAKHSFANFNKDINRYLADPNGKLFDIQDLGFNEDDVKVSVVSQFEGRPRLVDLSDTMQIRPYYGLKGQLSFDSHGHPTFDSIDEEAIELLSELQKEFNETAS